MVQKLSDNKTHLVGALRNNRKQNLKDVSTKKLKKGDFIAQQSDYGIVFMKWKDKRDVLVLSTKHKDTIVETQNKYVNHSSTCVIYGLFIIIHYEGIIKMV